MNEKNLKSEAISGWCSGVFTRFLIAPFDVLKIRFQNQVVSGSRYTGILNAIKEISINEGCKGLWKGTVPGMTLWGTYSMVQFPVYRELKRSIKKHSVHPALEAFCCGGIAACIAQTISFPVDTLRTRMATYHLNEKAYNFPIYKQVKIILQREGFRGFFCGWFATMLQVAPNNALVFMIYENLDINSLKSHPILSYISKGTIAGLSAKLITYPLDTVKKRLQLNGTVSYVPHYKGTFDCIKQTIRNEGYSAFYKGLSPQLYKTGVSYALSFTIFEVMLKTIKKNE